MRLPLMNLIRLKGFPILHQLHIEEQLLRTSLDNWCIVNEGTPDPTIVMGISGSPAKLIKIEPVLQDGVPVIKRFTGGGTVVVDSGTIFVTLICNKEAIAGLQPYPRPIMEWSGLMYSRVFDGVADFHLRENGNMAYLKLPNRAPEYRLARDHLEFVCCMKDYISRSNFIDKTIEAIKDHFSTRVMESDALSNTKFQPSTRLLTRQELEVAASASRVENSCSQSLLFR